MSNVDQLNKTYSQEEELRKARYRVKDSIKKNKGEEIINVQRSEVRKLAEGILVLNSVRHSGIGKDVDYLNNLELGYLLKGYMSNFRIAQSIVINEDYISVAGIEVRRYDECDELNKQAGIFKSTDGKQTLYKLKSAKRKAASIGLEIMSTTQLKKIISAMPGFTTEEKTTNFINIFNLEFGGYFEYHSFSIRNAGEVCTYWITSSTRDRMYSLSIKQNKVESTMRASIYNAHSLRCVRKQYDIE